jgi:carboxypeptidase family protein
VKAFVILWPLLLSQFSAATTVVVSNYTVCSSGRDVVVVVKDHGTAANNVRLDIYRKIEHGERSYWTGYTGSDGSARPIALAAGTYRVFADAGKHDATLNLTVTDSQEQLTTCKMDVSPRELAPTQTVSVSPPPRIVLRTFRGFVQDANEAVIPMMSVRLFLVHPKSTDFNSIVYSDEKGQFDLNLAPGSYVAFFQSQGFRERSVAFDIDPKGWQGFQLTMEVGGSLTHDPLPEEWLKTSEKR